MIHTLPEIGFDDGKGIGARGASALFAVMPAGWRGQLA
jgi:hypothetical protein